VLRASIRRVVVNDGRPVQFPARPYDLGFDQENKPSGKHKGEERSTPKTDNDRHFV